MITAWSASDPPARVHSGDVPITKVFRLSRHRPRRRDTKQPQKAEERGIDNHADKDAVRLPEQEEEKVAEVEHVEDVACNHAVGGGIGWLDDLAPYDDGLVMSLAQADVLGNRQHLYGACWEGTPRRCRGLTVIVASFDVE